MAGRSWQSADPQSAFGVADVTAGGSVDARRMGIPSAEATRAVGF